MSFIYYPEFEYESSLVQGQERPVQFYVLA